MKNIYITENEKKEILKKHSSLILEQKNYTVRDIQIFLNNNGYNLDTDNILGPKTYSAYQEFVNKKPKEKMANPKEKEKEEPINIKDTSDIR